MTCCASLRSRVFAVVLAVVILAMPACRQASPTDEPEAKPITPQLTLSPTPSEQPTDPPKPTPDPTNTLQPTATATSLPDVRAEGVAFVSNDKIHIVDSGGGEPQQLVPHRIHPDGLAWSPDGQRIAYVAWRGGGQDIFVAEVGYEGADPYRLTDTPVDETQPAWSPDGERIAFCAQHDDSVDIFLINVDGTGIRQLTSHEGDDCAPDWSPDGSQIAFESDRDGNREIYIMPVPSTDEAGAYANIDDAAQRLTTNTFNDYAPAWSPDGTRIAFYSSRGGAYDIYVMGVDGTGERQLTNDGTSNEWWPSWSPDGRQIAYCKLEASYLHEIYVMDVSPQGQSSHQQRLTVSTADDWFPAWRPVPAAAAGEIEGASASYPENVIVSVPVGEAPVVDGRLSSGEWSAAVVETLSDGSELLLMRDDFYLYLGIRSVTRERIAANVYVADGDRINIHHASAALGTAVYEAVEDGWEQTRGFDWKCRASGNDDAAVAERADYLREEHWVAGNAWMGVPHEMEYQIEWTASPHRIAVSLMRSSTPDERAFWPVTLEDDCTKPTPGGMPLRLDLVPSGWAEIDLMQVTE